MSSRNSDVRHVSRDGNLVSRSCGGWAGGLREQDEAEKQ